MPSPCPLDAPRNVNHAAVEFAVHAHSRAVVTLIVPPPPDAGTERSVSAIETLHRGTVEGAVDVVEELPHAAPVTAANTATMSPVREFVIDERARSSSERILACQKAEAAAS